MPDQGDIVLIPVPFTDLSSQKRRPVVVISNDCYHRANSDMVVVAMTSVPNNNGYTFTITQKDLKHGNLNRPGIVRVDKVYTLAQGLTAKVFGRVNDASLEHIRDLIADLIAKK